MVCHDTRASSRVLPIRRPWPREPLRGGESRPELWVQSAPGSQKLSLRKQRTALGSLTCLIHVSA